MSKPKIYDVIATGTTESRDIRDRFAEVASVKDFGAVGDGIADDTHAITAAIQSGMALRWGDRGDVYRITNMIELDIDHQINWTSNGATILQDAAAPVLAVIKLTVTRHDHSISGPLFINAAMIAYVGLYIEKNTTATVYPDDYANLRISQLRIENTYRSSTEIKESACGILIKGPFDVVTLESPIVRNSVLAAGAGVMGLYGAFGIRVTATDAGTTQSLNVLNPVVDTVICEDNTYEYDQDGLAFIVDPGVNAAEPSLRIIGGVFRDCSNRSIKNQAENCIVDGTRFTRRKPGFARGYAGVEIDCQEGGGVVKNIQCLYVSHAPQYVVQFSSTRQPGKKNVPFSSLDTADIILQSAAMVPLTAVFINQVANNGTEQVIRVSNVTVRGLGNLTFLGRFIGENNGTGFHLVLSDNVASPTGAWIECPSRTAAGTIKASREINLGAAIVFRRANYETWRPVLSARDCVGFVEATSGVNATSASGVLERIGLLSAASGFGGGVKVFGCTLAAGETYAVPVFGANSNQGLLFVAASGAQRCGMFTRDSTGVYALAAGNDITAGTTSEPSSGSHKLWYDTSLGQHVLRNSTAGIRSYTLVAIG